MEKEDNEINPQDSVMEKEDQEINWMEEEEEEDEEEAAGSAAQPSNGRLLVKLRLPKMPEEEETAAAKEVKNSHYCKECNKSFNSGKALGGHMSSAHVQANKEYSYRKQLNPKTKSGGANPCPLCEKAFPSKKSLFGHMRCHPNRRYRGMEPPPPPESEGFGLKNQDADTDSGSGSGSSEMVYSFQDWPSTSKRGRGYVRAQDWGPDDRETFAAGHQLLRLIDESNKKQIKTSPQTALRIGESDEIKGKGKVPLEEEEELYRTAIQVLMDVKRGGVIKEEKTSIPKEKMDECGGAGSKSSSPEAYMCNLCERGFSTHQALGGHRASHKKFKLTIINTADRDQKPNKETNGEKVVLGFDLNMMPEDQDVDEDEHHCI